MTARALLARLTDLGVSAEADHGALRLRPASAIPPDLLAMLAEHKAELLAVLTVPANDLGMLPPPAVPAAIDMGALPAGPCSGCGGGLWWRLSVMEARNHGPWRCRRCYRPDPAAWLDGHAFQVLARPNAGRR